MSANGIFIRFTNSLLLILLSALTISGLYGLVWGTAGWVFDFHRAAGWTLLAIAPWKVIIATRSLTRGLAWRFDRGPLVAISLLLAGLTILVIALALAWAWRLEPRHLNLWQSVISWHWMLSLVLLPPLAVHVWQHWPRPRKSDFVSRRGFLKLAGAALAGSAGWWMAETLAQERQTPDAPRRHTGSRGVGFFSGNRFPVTNMIGEGKERISPDDWQLAIAGLVEESLLFSYQDFNNLPQAELIATLDCTSGWYSIQDWQGVWLRDLLARAKPGPIWRAIRIKAVSGYSALYTPREADQILLATRVGNEVLEHWHGFPLRAVVPARRGWFWIKWINEIEVV